METLKEKISNAKDARTRTPNPSATWLGTGAKRSFKALDSWVREPDDKQKSRGRLGTIGLAVALVIGSAASSPLIAILVIAVISLTLFAIMAQYGDVILKDSWRREEPAPQPVTEAPAQPFRGAAETPPKTPVEEAPRAPVTLPKSDPQEAPVIHPPAPPGGAMEDITEGAVEDIEPSVEDTQVIPVIASDSFLESEPTKILGDTPTIRLRPSSGSADQQSAPVEEQAAPSPQGPAPEDREVVEESPEVPLAPSREALGEAEQTKLWSEPSAPLGGRIRLMEGGMWAPKNDA